MKILFICGSLEPGRDGVGDYTRSLASELINLGHDVILCAFNDRFVENAFNGNESIFQGPVRVFRLSWRDACSARERKLRSLLSDYKPDLVSVQFVMFSFDTRGLCWRWLLFQNELGAHYKLHVMFHEVWVGWFKIIKISSRLLGIVQWVVLVLFLRKNSICFVTTHVELYREMLLSVGLRAKMLPVFGSIPVLGPTHDKAKANILRRMELPDGGNYYLAGFFGAILSTINLVAFRDWLRTQEEKGHEVVVVAAGRHDSSSADNFSKIKEICGHNHVAVYLGSLSTRLVSEYLSALDEGLTSYPVELVGKSSAVAAMYDHGLKVTALGKFGRRDTGVSVAIKPIDGNLIGVGPVSRRFIEIVSSEC